MNFSANFKVQDVSEATEGDLGPRDVLATVLEEPRQDVLGTVRLQFPPDAEVPEVGDVIVARFTVIQENGMPKTAGMEGIERQSLT